MKIIANVIGIAAVLLFVLSYQFKTRRGIILFNAGSRILYVLQYVLLGAFEGAILDIVALLVTVVSQKKEWGWLKKHPKLTIIAANLFVVGIGLVFYQNVFSLLPIAGVLFETGALWLNKEKAIRIVSFFGAPCWLAYNLIFSAYGSAAGNIMTMISISIAILRYDILKQTERLSKNLRP